MLRPGHLRVASRLGCALAACIVLCSVAAPAWAWGPVGHRTVGAVADALLTGRARATVADLLADDLDRNGQPSGRRTLADVANWPDEIRGTADDHPKWHYDNRPVCAETDREGGWCARGECATAQIEANLQIVADPGRPRAERNAALKWVVHLAGDLHQPLHAADLAEGGNRIHVRPHGRSRGGLHEGGSLHSFWDTRLVTLALHAQDGAISDRTLQRVIERARGATAEQLAAPPAQWAQESNDIARSFALRVDGIECALGNHRGGSVTVDLPGDYVFQGRQIVEERLALAGARLARALNERLQ